MRQFKVGDLVVVRDRIGDRQGRVISIDRIHKYGHSVVVQCDDGDIETFNKEGTRHYGESYIRLGKIR